MGDTALNRELHAVIATSHIRNVQNLRPFAEVQPAGRQERVAVHASSRQFRRRGGLGSEGLRIERIEGRR
jgi:hypothetical protein